MLSTVHEICGLNRRMMLIANALCGGPYVHWVLALGPEEVQLDHAAMFTKLGG
jgi:hypothetical protein